MNLEQTNRGTAAALGFLLVSGIFAALAVALVFTLKAPAINAERGAERAKALAEVRLTEEKALTTAAMLDAQRGLVRLPVERAMQLAAEAWKNPAAARADLIARVEKATAELPKAPAQPSAFE
jgi:hypothetical protein